MIEVLGFDKLFGKVIFRFKDKYYIKHNNELKIIDDYIYNKSGLIKI